MTQHAARPFERSQRLTALAIASFCCCLSAHAQSSLPTMSYSGFGTLGATSTNNSQADFVVPGQPHGANKSITGGVDTKLGLQATAKFNDTFSATGQVLTKQNGDGNWNPGVEWLFAKAKITPDVSVRVGRMGIPAFAVSDFRDVNYANVWVRPPLDVYGQVAFSHFDGADLNWQTTLGDAIVNTQVFGGQASSVYTHTDLDLKRLMGFNVTLEIDGGWTLRIGHLKSRLTVHNSALDGLVATLAATPFASVGEQLSATDKPATFSGLGLGYDNGPWVLSAEYTRRKTDSYVSSTTGWSTSAGYRIAAFTPYVVVSKLKVDDTNVDNTIPKGVSGGLDMLSAAVDGTVATTAVGQKTVSLGMRWDVHRNTALKFQIDRIRTDGGNGLFGNAQPGFGSGTQVTVYGVSVDVVF